MGKNRRYSILDGTMHWSLVWCFIWGLLLFCWGQTPSYAQFGLGAILNPEGSRLFPYILTLPRHPGKPDPRWKEFNWKYVDREVHGVKYRLYFYDEEGWIVEFVTPKIDEEIKTLGETFHYHPSRKFTYLLLGSRREFQQIHIFNISEGVQGITSTTEQTMAIPYWGHAKTFEHISTHEMIHQFQIQKVTDLASAVEGDQRSYLVLSLIPLWFIEGMAEYYSLGGPERGPKGGVDPETAQYIRDLVLNPDPEKEYKLPKLTEPGPLNFINVYKVGQVKIAFFESQFGKDTVQQLLKESAEGLGGKYKTFEDLLATHLKLTPDELEKKWNTYIEDHFKKPGDAIPQALQDFEEVKELGENLDFFKISPDGKLIATREIDPVSGVVSIKLAAFDNLDSKITAAADHRADLLSLYFMQVPVLALGDHEIAYVVGTISGPELEVRKIIRSSKNGKESFELGRPRRIALHQMGLIEASSPAFSPDGSKIALVGLEPKGWENIFELDLTSKNEDRNNAVELNKLTLNKLTNDPYSYRSLAWSNDGIYAASDQTPKKNFNLFRIEKNLPHGSKTGSDLNITQLTFGDEDQLAPSVLGDRLVYQSWKTGSSQIHKIQNKGNRGEETQITHVKTGLANPELRGDDVYALGFKSGRYHVYRVAKDKQLKIPIQSAKSKHASSSNHPSLVWKPELLKLPSEQVEEYRPFLTSGAIRLEDLGAFLSTGGVGGVSVVVSDLMRDYSFSGQFAYLGKYGLTNTFLLFGSRKGRSTWNVGAYSILQPRVDNLFITDEFLRTYLHKEYGGVGAFQYPLGAFSFVDLSMRLAGVNRTDFSDLTLRPQWDQSNPGTEFLLSPVVRLGYDAILYELFSGPLSGYSALVESEMSYFPGRAAFNERLRLDLAYYLQPFSTVVLAFQGLMGASWNLAGNQPGGAGSFVNSFLISSDDILRGYNALDSRLFGNYVMAAKTEIRFPIGSLFHFPILRGLLAYDIGTVFNYKNQIQSHISSSYSAGLTMNIPPLSINFLLSYPGMSAPGPVERPVPHFVLRYLYM